MGTKINPQKAKRQSLKEFKGVKHENVAISTLKEVRELIYSGKAWLEAPRGLQNDERLQADEHKTGDDDNELFNAALGRE